MGAAPSSSGSSSLSFFSSSSLSDGKDSSCLQLAKSIGKYTNEGNFYIPSSSLVFRFHLFYLCYLSVLGFVLDSVELVLLRGSSSSC